MDLDYWPELARLLERVLIATSDIEEAAEVADLVAVMRNHTIAVGKLCFSKCQASVKKVSISVKILPLLWVFIGWEWVDIARRRRDAKSPASGLNT